MLFCQTSDLYNWTQGTCFHFKGNKQGTLLKPTKYFKIVDYFLIILSTVFNTIFTFSAVSFHELEREREWESKLCCWKKKKSKPTTNSFLKKSVLVVIKHVYNWQVILSTGEILFIHLQHNITRKIMLVINPHVLNAVWGFWECHVYLLSCHCNPSPPTSSPDTLPTTLSPLWCTYQPISPLIFFTWMWTMLWCLTDSGWAQTPILGERTVFPLHMASLWVSVLPGKEFLQCWGGQLQCLYEPTFPTHSKLTRCCVAIFMSQSPKQYMLLLHRNCFLRHDAKLCKHVALELLRVLAEQVDVCLQHTLQETSMAMFALY